MAGENMDYTIVGKIINSHGIKGEVKVYPLTHDIDRFSYLKYAYLGEEKVKVEIHSVKYHKGIVIIRFKEYDDINQILKFKDMDIYVDEDNKIILPKDHYFIYDLINCQVFDVKGNNIGYISDVIQAASNDVYVIKDPEKNRDYLIPVVKEFVKQVDIDNKKVIIDPIEGMIEWLLMF